MEKNLLGFKAGIAASVTAISAFLGWKGILGLCWLAAMALDYVSGTAAACRAGAWSSKIAREGLWHKCGMIFAVAVAGIADVIMALLMGNIPGLGIRWPGLTLPLVLAWYILTELGSILENAHKMGAAVPPWLTKLLKASREAVDSGSRKEEA